MEYILCTFEAQACTNWRRLLDTLLDMYFIISYIIFGSSLSAIVFSFSITEEVRMPTHKKNKVKEKVGQLTYDVHC